MSSRARGKGLRVLWIDNCGAGRGQVEGRSCRRRKAPCRRKSGSVHRRVEQRRRRSAGYGSYPPPALGLPIQSGCLMEQERGGRCGRARREEKEKRR